MSEIRRVVLGVGTDGRSRVTADGSAPVVHTNPRAPGYSTTEIWATDKVPPPLDGDDPTLGHSQLDVAPPTGATRFWVAEFPAKSNGVTAVMHATDSLDYLVIMSGSVTLELENGKVQLHAGDTAIQRGNQHAWRNEGDEPCRVAVVMVGAPDE